MFPTLLPQHRLDAGTLGVMGVGAGYAIAAALIGTEGLEYEVHWVRKCMYEWHVLRKSAEALD